MKHIAEQFEFDLKDDRRPLKTHTEDSAPIYTIKVAYNESDKEDTSCKIVTKNKTLAIKLATGWFYQDI